MVRHGNLDPAGAGPPLDHACLAGSGARPLLLELPTALAKLQDNAPKTPIAVTVGAIEAFRIQRTPFVG